MEKDKAPDPASDPSTLLDKVNLFARTAAIVAAGFPHTSLPPIVLWQAFTRRYRREALLQKLHFMPVWGTVVSRYILGMKLDVAGMENLPNPSRGHMYVSNHQSYADIFLLMHSLRTAAFLSKKVPVKYIPFVGRGAYCGGTIYVDRSEKDSRALALEETLRMCEESVAVVVFPEGTRSADGELREKTYPRALQLAHDRGLRLLPVGVHGTFRVVPKAMDRIRTGQHVAVRIGPALIPDNYASPDAYAEACWDEVAALHREAKEAVALAQGLE